MPRTAADQATVGTKVQKKNIKQGDLVFFRGRKTKKTGHVGIITKVEKDGKFQFIHASTSKGINIDNSELSYYKSRYIQTRRVIR